MEQIIRDYEEFIKKKATEDLAATEREKLAAYHQEMVANFQHERLIHMIVMFFFIAVALVLLGICSYSICDLGFALWLLPLYVLTAIVSILSCFYVKHYYFLENHIQELYKYNKILRLQEKK